jgi:hypothetical protein
MEAVVAPAKTPPVTVGGEVMKTIRKVALG